MNVSEIAAAATPDEVQLLEDLPEIIPNSELQLDADISCYHNAWPEQALSTDIANLKRHIEVKRLLAACEIVNVYTTNGGKTGREDIAVLSEYQKGRSTEPAKAERVRALRSFLVDYASNTVVPKPQWEIEADDAMSIRQRECIAEGKVSKLMTVDKDLDMVPGTHINFDTFEEVEHPDGYGRLWMEKKGELKSKGGSGVTNKLKGIGTSFFFAQLLMGDGADDIPGLPKLTTKLLNRYKPTKALEKALKTLKNPKATALAKKKAKLVINDRKPSGVGPAIAYVILKDCKTNKCAFQKVKEAYAELYGPVHKFTSWKGKRLQRSSGAMLIEQAKLLWMLRTIDDDVLDFFKSI